MRNFKRFLTLALAVVMLVSAFAMGTSAAKFTDVDENNEYLAKSVGLLSYVGVTKGTTDTTFGTEDLVTREQMAAFIYRLMKKGSSVEGGDNTSAFTDLEDPTFFFMVSWANNQGIIKGTSASTFEPKGSIVLQDAYTMIVRALGYEKEEALSYPFDYIDIAESKDVALNEGLEDVNYTDALTRGDVAVLLYNAFFAKTGVAETKQVEREIGVGANATWVLETVTDYPTFCEKYFDVIEVEYQAIATPNYTFGAANETTSELGYDAIEFVYVGDERTDAPAQFYAAFEDLGLEGKADDYIMSHFTMYVILDSDDEIEEILYAEPLMVKKNVTEIKLDTVATNTRNSYINVEEGVKRLNGKVTLGDEVAYFYGAPYSYITPKYTTAMDDEDKYNARNEKNLVFIYKAVVGDAEDGEYRYAIEGGVDAGAADEYFEAGSVALIEALKAVYVGGPYEADIYDVDGDGIYDYILYMPYSVFFVDDDEDFTFFDDGGHDDYVYTNEAVVEGVEFKNEDLVIGYVDPAANYIKAVAVVEPIEGAITGIKKATGIITLNGETKVSVKDGWKVLANDIDLDAIDYVVGDYEWNDFDALLNAGALDAKDAKFYVYNDMLLYQDGIDNFVTFDKNLIVVTPDEDGNVVETGAFNIATGKRTTYVHVWVGGETKYVPVDTDAEIAPSIKDDLADYVGKVATYSQDENGLYTIELLGYAEDADGDYIGITWLADLEADKDLTNEKNADIQAYEEYAEGYLVKNSGKRFRLRAEATRAGAAVEAFDFIIDDNTTMLIKNTYADVDGEDVVDYLKLDNLTETIESKLENIQVIIANNVDYTNRENLVLLYAEVNGEELEYAGKVVTKSERIIKMMDVAMNEDGKFYAVYDLFNPYTGALVENVAGTNVSTSNSYVSKFTYGDIVKMSGDKVADKAADTRVGTVIGGNADLYWVLDYNAEESAIEIIKVPTVADGETVEEVVEAAQVYRIDVTGAPVTLIGNQSSALGQDMIRWGSIKVANVAKLDGSDKTYLATARWAKNDNTALKTVYSHYVKIYLDAEWEDDADHTVVNEDDFNAEANFIVVIANGSETQNLCVLK